jgi:ubiquinol-cytochrome c reductase cytochrome c1 subunit
MFKKLTTGIALALTIAAGVAQAAGSEGHVNDHAFSFEGPFGSYDQEQLRRGLKVYTEICSACHGMKFVAIRSLGDEGGPLLSKDEVRAYASEFVEVWDQSLNDGEGDYRAALPADHFPKGGNANAPDLSLMAKARAGFHGPAGTGINQLVKGMGGAEYILSLLTGYTGEEKTSAGVTLYENTAYPGGWISMSPPLYGEDVEFADGHKNDLEHLSEDITAFLMWTAEPKLNDRKRAGLVGVLILGFLTLMLFFANKALWRPIKYKKG